MTEPGSYGDDAEFLAEFCPAPADAERVLRAAERLMAENRGRILAGLRRSTGTDVADLARAMDVDPEVVAAVEAGRETSVGAVLGFVAALGGHLVLEVVPAAGRRAGFDLSVAASAVAGAEDFGEWCGRRRAAAAAAARRPDPALPPLAERGGAGIEVVLVAVVDGWRADLA